MTFQFKIKIDGLKEPEVWRRVSVPANYSFHDLHTIIQIAFGWEDCHMYMFSPEGYGSSPVIQLDEGEMDSFMGSSIEIKDAEETKLSEIFTTPKQKFTYLYDFGDDWLHQIVLEKIHTVVSLLPIVSEGEGTCPPEDCGGIGGYHEIKIALANKRHPDHKSAKEWLGLEPTEKWDTNAFDVIQTQAILLEVFGGRKS